MLDITKFLRYIAAGCIAAAIGVTAVNAFGQDAKETRSAEREVRERSFCNNNNWSDSGRVSASELREFTIPASGKLSVDGGRNGGISVKGQDRNDVLVRACVQTWGDSDAAAKASASNIRIANSGIIKAENAAEDKNWSVSYEILVPRSTDVDLTAHNGGISVSGTNGSAEVETMNGGVNLKGVTGTVKGRTTNGGVNVTLGGADLKGGIDVQTTNGGIMLTIPESIAANVEMSTVNGGMRSEIPSLNVTTEDFKGQWGRGSRPKHINTTLNGGGAPIRLATTNGGVVIRASER